MRLRHLELQDFRNYVSAEVPFSEGFTAVIGANGQGKTNLLEAIGYLATLSSFRGAPTEALVRAGAERAYVRAEAERDGRELLIEAEIGGPRNRIQVNRQPLKRARDLLGALRVTVFSPDDLGLVKDGPGGRRDYLDATLVALHPKYDALARDVDKILRQRNALLRQSGGRLDADAAVTLDVWDERFAQAGDALALARDHLLDDLRPRLASAYERVARTGDEVTAVYVAPWREGGLAAALAASRADDLRRGATTTGPHRDELELRIAGLPARTHASQGEQRSLALALRVAAHEVVTSSAGVPPMLLLDDVFSELDPQRSAALLAELPSGVQTVLTTAGPLPESTHADLVVRIDRGSVVEGALPR